MDENDALRRIATIQGVINNVIPVGKDGKPERLTYVEKFDLIFGGRDEKIKKALRMIDDLESEADSLYASTNQLDKSLQKIRDVLES
uniref:Uncharacterized protein n=1 Tax=uncultured marine crenarchaeote SAT1000-23-F7 TaxID=526690 RepID=B3V5D8_9ARCH|nr:hypothetical protein [uncultured marine crenarchaeote SAT1000-23-F7]